MTHVRWGILGTGNIAAQFARDLTQHGGGEIVAVGSRSQSTASAFGDAFAIGRRHSSYEALVADESVDVVYIATPHTLHEECALLAMAHGRHVLIEKPFAVNGAQARRIIEVARESGVFAMEAMWTRFLPHITLVRQLVRDGALGDVRSVTADFGERFDPQRMPRAYDPGAAGGALLDLGIYPLSLASMLFGRPLSVAAVSPPNSFGVDLQTSVTLSYATGRLAVLFASIEAHTATRASINGTLARIEIDGDFLAPAALRLVADDGTTTDLTVAHDGRGLRHQAREVERCIRAGLTESPVMSLGETLEIVDTMDEIRRQVGVIFPADVDA